MLNFLLLSFFFFIIIHDCLARMEPMDPMCLTSSSTTSTQTCTLTFSPFMVPQIPPITTIYEGILTKYFDIVDCRYCTVTNSRKYSAPSGSFTDKITLPLLTVTEIRCMPTTTAVIRRGIRGFENDETSDIHDAILAEAVKPHIPHAYRLPRRQTGGNNTLPSLQLTGDALKYFVQCNTALYALNLCNSGFNLTALCTAFQDPDIVAPLAAVQIDAIQAKDIICFAAVIGINFAQTNIEIIQSIAATIYAIQIGSNFTGTTNTTDLCNGIDFSPEPYLGIDASGAQDFICNATNSTATSSMPTTTGPLPTVNITMSPATSFSNISTEEASSGVVVTAGPTGTQSGSMFPGNMTGNMTVWPSGTGAGTIAVNNTGGEPFNVSWPQTGYGTSSRLPPSPQTTRYYPAFVTTTTTQEYRGY